jgi:hypothetical protein
MLSGCQHAIIRNMITERHNKASRIIIEALNKGAYGANLVYTDVGSNTRFSDEGLDITHIANRTLPAWLLCNLSEQERSSSSRPDAIFILPANSCSTQLTDLNSAPRHFESNQFNPHTWDVHLLELKFCEDTRPEAQLARAREQHSLLIDRLRSHHYNSVKLHTILCGVMGTIYSNYTDTPLRELGLNSYQNSKLTHKLNGHAIRQASKLIRTRYTLQKNRNVGANTTGQMELGASARNPPDPH